MENASKALIIAGAILLAILLISIGIMVFNMVTEPIEEAGGQMAGMGPDMFNSRWVGYTRGQQSASQIRALIGAVNAHNSNDGVAQIFITQTNVGGAAGATIIDDAEGTNVGVWADALEYVNLNNEAERYSAGSGLTSGRQYRVTPSFQRGFIRILHISAWQDAGETYTL